MPIKLSKQIRKTKTKEERNLCVKKEKEKEKEEGNKVFESDMVGEINQINEELKERKKREKIWCHRYLIRTPVKYQKTKMSQLNMSTSEL